MGNKGGDVLSNVEILTRFADRIGAEGFRYDTSQDVTAEMLRAVPDYQHLSVEEISSPDGAFARKDYVFKRLVSFTREKYTFDSNGKSEYPYVFTTARNRYQFCTGGASSSSKTLRDLARGPRVFVNPDDAELIGVQDGDRIRIESEVGSIEAEVQRDAGVSKRIIVAPFHFEKLLVNRLTPRKLDPDSGTPCYKQVHVKVEKM